jgi:hypothetical protein
MRADAVGGFYVWQGDVPLRVQVVRCRYKLVNGFAS